jgi:PhnB protein
MAIQGSEWTPGAIVPHLTVRNLDESIDFYRAAFGAIELYRSPATAELGQLASLKIWNSVILVSAELPVERPEKPELAFVASPETLRGTTCVFQICVPDADDVYHRAVRSGALPAMPLADMFWGDRYGWVRDPFGYLWAICSVNEIVSPEENDRRMFLATGRKVETR